MPPRFPQISFKSLKRKCALFPLGKKCQFKQAVFIAQERSESFSYLQRVPLHLGAPQCGAFRAVSDSFRAEKTGKGKVANNKPHQHCYLSMVGFDLHCFDQT